MVNRGESTLGEALIKVTKDPDLKEAYFMTPLALTASESPTKFQKTSQEGNYDWSPRPKGKGKGKFQAEQRLWKGLQKQWLQGQARRLELGRPRRLMGVTFASPSTHKDAMASAAAFMFAV